MTYPYKKVQCRTCKKYYTINKDWAHYNKRRCPTCEFKYFRNRKKKQ